MTKFVREFTEVPDRASLDEVIDSLIALRASLPEGAEAELRMRGDDVFGRRLTISHLRPQTAEEVAFDERYDHAYRQSRERQLADLQAEIGAHRPPSISLAA